MKRMVDTSDPGWRTQRSELWEAHYGDFTRNYWGRKLPDFKKIQMKAHKALYMGDATSINDPVIANWYIGQEDEFEAHQDDPRPAKPFECFSNALFLSPHQCEANWVWMIEEGWRQWVPEGVEWSRMDLFTKMFLHVSYRQDNVVRDWGGDQALFHRFFETLAGSQYDPENYAFNGEHIGKHPLKPTDVLKLFSNHVCFVVSGYSPFEALFVKQYEYAIQAFDYVNPEIFEPESKLEKRDEYKLKDRLVSALYTIHCREEEYLERREGGRLTDYWKERSIEDWRQSPEINGLIRQLEDDMTNGRFPESVGRLYHWVAAKAAKEKKKVASKKAVEKAVKKAKPTAIVLDEKVEQYVCNELETYRQLAIAGGMTGLDIPFDSFKSYTSWKKAKTTLARNKRAEFFRYQYKNHDDYPSSVFTGYVEELFPKNIVQISLDVLDEFQPGSINREYRNVFNALSTMVSDHVTINEIKTRKPSKPASGYDIAVTLVTDRQKHVFTYGVANEWMDEAFLSDFNVFAEAEELPWRFRWDDGDSAKTVVYLPEVFDVYPLE